MNKIEQRTYEAAVPFAKELGYDVYWVQYIKEGPYWYLRVFIDKEDGITIDDCTNVSHAIDPILDEADPIPDSYVFEVGSAGIERELKRPSDFERYMGSEVELRLYQPHEGSKVFVGTLSAYNDGTVTISSGGREMSFTKAQTAQVKLHVSI